MKFEIRNRWTGNVQWSCELDAEFAGKSYGIQLGAAIKLGYKSGANLSDANLRDAYLSGADLSDANLRGADLSGADLSDAYLRGADLSDANLRDADLSDANLRDANLRGAYLSDAYLSDANLRDANLRDANLSDANLSDANLRDANLSDANLRGAYLSGADLRGADLSDANLKPVQVDFFDVLLRASTNGEVPGLIAALKEGRVDGSTYEGECACLVGTIANVKKLNYNHIPDLRPDSGRPIERFFMSIRKGDTPETNTFSKLAVEWAEDFQRLMARTKEKLAETKL